VCVCMCRRKCLHQECVKGLKSRTLLLALRLSWKQERNVETCCPWWGRTQSSRLCACVCVCVTEVRRPGVTHAWRSSWKSSHHHEGLKHIHIDIAFTDILYIYSSRKKVYLVSPFKALFYISFLK